MARTHILYKTFVDELDSEIAKLKNRRKTLLIESTIDIQNFCLEFKNVKKFNYQYDMIWYDETRAMKKMLPFIESQEEYTIPIAMGVLLHIERGNDLYLTHSSKDSNKILPFLKKYGVKRSAIDYTNKIYWRDEAIKTLKKEQKEVDAIGVALKEVYGP